ncbi:MAG: 2-hydroxyacyl-CoA dehydratase [Planctomycetota bacterium]|nr:2-hydroxyacyl-CoA dehydratase [Planctomycetota bacterium]
MKDKLFTSWQGQDLDEILLQCRDLAEDPDYPTVSKWRQQGGKVVGAFQVYFPEELVHAAGMLPLKIRGATLAPDQADSHFGSYLCSIIKTSLELVLSNRVELDMFITHPICDAARNLAAIWGRNYDYTCQILYLPQNPNSGASVDYLSDEYNRLRRELEQLSGNEISAEALNNSIKVYNSNRELLRRLYKIKRDTPWKIGADDAYALVAIGGMMLREEHNDFLQQVLPLIEAREAKQEDRIRVVFEGAFCEQPPLGLIRTIGQSCYVVDDDFLIGMRYLLNDVKQSDDPVRELAWSYINDSSYSPVQHDLNKRKEDMFLDRYRSARGEAAIIAAAKMCEPGLEEQVAYIQALDKENIPYFVSEFEENMTSFASLELQIDTFMENILFA